MRAKRSDLHPIVARERARAMRDIGLAVVQASTANPHWLSALEVLVGGGLWAIGDATKVSAIGNTGKGLMAMGGVSEAGAFTKEVLDFLHPADKPQLPVLWAIPDDNGASLKALEALNSPSFALTQAPAPASGQQGGGLLSLLSGFL